MSNLEVTKSFEKYIQSYQQMTLGTFLYLTDLHMYSYVETHEIKPESGVNYRVEPVKKLMVDYKTEALNLEEFQGVEGYWLRIGRFNAFSWFIPKTLIHELFSWRSHPSLLDTPAFHFVNHYFQVDGDKLKVSAKATGTHMYVRDPDSTVGDVIRFVLSRGV